MAHLLQPDAVDTIDRTALAQYLVRDDLCDSPWARTDDTSRMRRHALGTTTKAIELSPSDVTLVYAFLNGDADVDSIAGVRAVSPTTVSLAQVPGSSDIVQYVADGAVFTDTLAAAHVVPPTSFAGLVVPDFRAAAKAYEQARSALQIPRSSARGGGGGMPKAITLSYVGAIVVWQQRVLTYARTAHLHTVFTGRDTYWATLRDSWEETQARKRGKPKPMQTRAIVVAKTQDLMAALYPWFGGFTFFPRMQALLEKAVEANTGGELAHFSTAARNDTGRLASQCVAPRISAACFWHIDISSIIPADFDWGSFPGKYTPGVTRPPSKTLYNKHEYIPILRGGMSVADAYFQEGETRQRHVPPGYASAQLIATPGTLYSWTYDEFVSHLMQAIGLQALAVVVCRLVDAPIELIETVEQVNNQRDGGVCHAEVAFDPQLDEFVNQQRDSSVCHVEGSSDPQPDELESRTVRSLHYNAVGETRTERSRTRQVIRDGLKIRFELKATLRIVRPYDCSRCYWIRLTFGVRAAHVVHALRDGSKSIESRRNLNIYGIVKEGWLLCCVVDTDSSPLWLIVREVFYYSSYVEAVRAHGFTLAPWVDGLLELSEVELEYTFFKINEPRAHARRGRSTAVERWHARTGSPNSVVCWRVSRVPVGALLPTTATLVADTPYGTSMSRPNAWATLYSGLQHNRLVTRRRLLQSSWCRLAGRFTVRSALDRKFRSLLNVWRLAFRYHVKRSLRLLHNNTLRFAGRARVFKWHSLSQALQRADWRVWTQQQRLLNQRNALSAVRSRFLVWRQACSTQARAAIQRDSPDGAALATPWVSLRLQAATGAVRTSLSFGGSVTRVIRDKGIVDRSLYEADKVNAICVFADCVSPALHGTAKQVASLFKYSNREYAISPNGSGYARRSAWREPGSYSTCDPPSSDCLASDVVVHHLHVKWSTRSPSTTVSPTSPKPTPGYRSSAVYSPDSDTLETRRTWLSQALGRLSASLTESYSGTIAFPWSDCAEYGISAITAFANRHPRARVLVVQRSSETVQQQLDRLRDEVKQASRDVRQYVKNDDTASPMTRQIAIDLSREIERTLLREVRAQLAQGDTSTSFPNAQEEVRRRFHEQSTNLAGVSRCNTLEADRARRRDNETTDEVFRSRLRDALTAGELSEDELHSMYGTHLRVREQGRLLASTADPDAPAVANMAAAMPIGTLRPAGRILTPADKNPSNAPEGAPDVQPPHEHGPSAPLCGERRHLPHLTRDVAATVALARDAGAPASVRVSSSYGRRTPCRLLDTFLSDGSSLHQLAVQALILDGGAGTCLWGADGTHGARAVMARYPKAVRYVEPLPSSIRRIAGVCSLSEVSFWVSFTLFLGGCECFFEDVPVLDGHSGLLLGNDCIAAARSQISYDSEHGGTVVFRHVDTLAPISRPIRFVCTDAAVHDWSSLCDRVSPPVTVALATDASCPPVSANVGLQDDGRVRVSLLVEEQLAPTPKPTLPVRTALRVEAGGRVSLKLNAASISSASEHALREVAPVGFTPKNVVCEPWSETLIPLQIPFSLLGNKKVGIVPLEDKATYGDLGVLIAPTIATAKDGLVHVRAINYSGKRVSLPLLTPIVRYVIDPTYTLLHTEYDPDALMDAIHVGVDDPAALRSCKAMLSRRLSAFRTTLSSTHLMRHEIRTPDVDSGKIKAPCAQNRIRPPVEMAALEEMVAKLRKEQCVEPGDPTEYNALPLILHKPDGSMRPALNYIGLNFASEKDTFPLPNVEANIAALGRANWFSTLDLLQGFLQVELEPSSKRKTAFTVGGRQWQFTRMPMGLSSSPGAFMRVVDAALRGLPPGIAFAYV